MYINQIIITVKTAFIRLQKITTLTSDFFFVDLNKLIIKFLLGFCIIKDEFGI